MTRMRLDFRAPFADAWKAWRRDHRLLLPIAGLTMFVPQLAQLLLIPEIPARTGASPEEAVQAISAWVGQWGAFYLIGPALSLFGALAVMSLYLAKGRPTVGGALAGALRLVLRYILAALLIALPLAGLMLPALAAPILLVVVLAPIFYVSARTMLVAPALVAEAPLSAPQAILRSWELTRGRGWLLACIYAALMLGVQMAAGIFLALGGAGRSPEGANPVVEVLTGGCASLFVAGGALALALVEVALYRRLASKGT